MSTTQKIIKNLALALAFFLIITIFGTIALVFNIIGNIFFNPDNILDNPKIVNISKEIPQRNYFPFYDYEYYLDVTKQKTILVNTTSLSVGLQKSYDWYKNNKEKINKKNYFDFIDNNL